jgi:NAD(P)-dependent dehydrogenase (short-subunit alcohol dehydrogenase family)
MPVDELEAPPPVEAPRQSPKAAPSPRLSIAQRLTRTRVDLRGLPIAITGASSGIGYATALACARAGMPVALGARRTDKLNTLAAQIRGGGGRAVAIACDVTNPDDCARLIQAAEEEFGSLHAVYANAGYGFEKPFTQTTDHDIRAIFETNFFGTLNTIRPALDLMLPRRRGHILICSSCLSKCGLPGLAPYSATKAAQDHLARQMRAELAHAGIAVSSIHPIGTRTEFFDQSNARSNTQSSLLRTPKIFMQPPERVASAILRNLRSGNGREVWTSLTVRTLFALATEFPAPADYFLKRRAAKQK